MTLRRDRRAAAGLEFALVFPALILFLVGMIAAYTLIAAKRAMEFGIEKGLRYAIAHGSGGDTAVKAAYNSAASTVWRMVGISGTVDVAPKNFVAGDTVTITATFAWAPPAGLLAPDNSTIFTPVTLSASGSARVMN